MPLTTVTISSVSPRGGYATSTITVSGVGFGIVAGIVKCDPAGVNVNAAIVSWVDDAVVFTTPAGLPTNKTITVQLIKSDASDFATFPFWSPAALPVVDNDRLDYQYPDLEAGTTYQDTDDPLKCQAADFNRLLDRVNATSAGDVPVSRSITTAAPLTGGGDLSANRIIGVAPAAAKAVLAGPTSGGSATPTFRALVAGDLPATVLLNDGSVPIAANFPFGGHRATGLASGIAGSDAATVAQLPGAPDLSHLIHDDGSVPMAAALAMGAHKITGLLNGTNPQDAATVSQLPAGALDMVGDSGAGGTHGLAPAPPPGSAAAGKFLKADATWAVPAGGSLDLTAVPKSIWLDAGLGVCQNNNFTNPAVADGDPVRSWASQDGYGNADVTGGIATFKPGIINGRPAVRFPGTLVTTGSYAFEQTLTLIAVIARPWTAANAYRGLLGQNGNNVAVWMDTPVGAFIRPWMVGGAGGANPSVGGYGTRPVFVDNTFHIFTAVWGREFIARFDGTTLVPAGAAPGIVAIQANQPLSIGDDSSGDHFDGDIAELMLIPNFLAFNTMHQIEQALGVKYGIPVA